MYRLVCYRHRYVGILEEKRVYCATVDDESERTRQRRKNSELEVPKAPSRRSSPNRFASQSIERGRGRALCEWALYRSDFDLFRLGGTARPYPRRSTSIRYTASGGTKMRALDGFNVAIERADHLLRLYDLLHDTRSRRVRREWAEKFKSIMRWPSGERICRVDGKNSESILIFRESVGIDNRHFSHDYLSELLRGSLVATVSALDRYLHDLVVENSWKLLGRPEAEIPTQLKKLSLPVLTTKRALERLRASPEARPGGLVKKAIQDQLHKEYTFQKPDSVIKAAQMLGIRDFWREVGKRMPSKPSANAVTERLKEIANRRNSIVHEADIVLKTKAKEITIRGIDVEDARSSLKWIRELVTAIDVVVADAV